MKRHCFYIFIVTGILFLNSCAPVGLVYTHTRRPLDTNMSRTPVDGRSVHGDLKHISFYVDVMWDSAAIGDIAKKNGLKTVYYADIETLRVFYIWNRYIVHVYGK
jgi:hypothetical protein